MREEQLLKSRRNFNYFIDDDGLKNYFLFCKSVLLLSLRRKRILKILFCKLFSSETEDDR